MGLGMHTFCSTRASVASSAGTAPRELFGYRIIDTIGQGAGSVVYAVKDGRGRKFAMKHVACESDRDGRFVEQLKREHEVSQAVADPAFRKSIALHLRRNLLGRVREAGL